MSSAPTITLFGAAGEVTGSCTLIETAHARVVVDFGMIQGSAEDERRNPDAPAIDWSRVDAVVLTHAHIDHCGRLPMLPTLGFDGAIWCTEATSSILPRVLRGSASLQQIRYHEWRNGCVPVARPIFEGDPLLLPRERGPEPPILFVNSQVTQTLARIRALGWDRSVEIANGVSLRFLNAGHVLGAASVELTIGSGLSTCVVVCSGDIGPRQSQLHRPPASPRRADVVVLESTNGARRRGQRADPEAELEDILAEAGPKRERVLIPTFALGRAQQLLYRLSRLSRRGALHSLNVYLDSAMAVRVADRFFDHPEYLAEEVQEGLERGEAALEFPELHRLTTRKQSIGLTTLRDGAIILAGAGFCDAGPILHHLVHGLDREDCRVVLAGFHPEGSIGDGLRRGVKLVEINGVVIEVRARVSEVSGLSGHAERDDLLAWLRGIDDRPSTIVLNHGTDEARAALAGAVESELGSRCATPVATNPVEAS